jgi:nucleoredoxin
MAAFTSLLGDSLVGKSGAVDTASALCGKVVGLYFSAHWCPPCRGFTPQLAESYVALTSGGKNFEIVFVSSDRDQHSFDEYYTSMPWLALPFAERDRKAQLSSAFKVSGIPCLVILDENAKEITRDGRTAIIDDPSGAKFPWHPPSLWELLGANVHRNSGEAVAVESLRSRVFALYFSAKWCPPCCRFTSSVLIGAYNTLKQRGIDFEIVFVSLDRDRSQYAEYFGSMPWTSLGFQSPNAPVLCTRYQVAGIPTLVVIDGADGAATTITTNGVSELQADTTLANFPWRPQPLRPLALAENEHLNDNVCLIALLDSISDDELQRTKDVLAQVAAKHQAAKSNILFFYSTGHDNVASRLREMFTITQSPTLLLMNLPNYYTLEAQQSGDSDTELTADRIESFLEFYQAGALIGGSMEGR